MKKIVTFIGALSMMFAVFGQANAADKKADVIALMEKAVAHYTQVGADQAFKDFASSDAGFMQGDLYLVIQDQKGGIVSHATNAKLNGKNVLKLKDADGKQFNRDLLNMAKKADTGWFKYKWSNPVTKKIGQKIAYYQVVGSEYIFTIGYYE